MFAARGDVRDPYITICHDRFSWLGADSLEDKCWVLFFVNNYQTSTKCNIYTNKA